tara:strand:- start:1169 stop:4126 length:2958 start_codon:yes stop_codon:yes gene_type:complete
MSTKISKPSGNPEKLKYEQNIKNSENELRKIHTQITKCVKELNSYNLNQKKILNNLKTSKSSTILKNIEKQEKNNTFLNGLHRIQPSTNFTAGDSGNADQNWNALGLVALHDEKVGPLVDPRQGGVGWPRADGVDAAAKNRWFQDDNIRHFFTESVDPIFIKEYFNRIRYNNLFSLSVRADRVDHEKIINNITTEDQKFSEFRFPTFDGDDFSLIKPEYRKPAQLKTMLKGLAGSSTKWGQRTEGMLPPPAPGAAGGGPAPLEVLNAQIPNLNLNNQQHKDHLEEYIRKNHGRPGWAYHLTARAALNQPRAGYAPVSNTELTPLPENARENIYQSIIIDKKDSPVRGRTATVKKRNGLTNAKLRSLTIKGKKADNKDHYIDELDQDKDKKISNFWRELTIFIDHDKEKDTILKILIKIYSILSIEKTSVSDFFDNWESINNHLSFGSKKYQKNIKSPLNNIKSIDQLKTELDKSKIFANEKKFINSISKRKKEHNISIGNNISSQRLKALEPLYQDYRNECIREMSPVLNKTSTFGTTKIKVDDVDKPILIDLIVMNSYLLNSFGEKDVYLNYFQKKEILYQFIEKYKEKYEELNKNRTALKDLGIKLSTLEKSKEDVEKLVKEDKNLELDKKSSIVVDYLKQNKLESKIPLIHSMYGTTVSDFENLHIQPGLAELYGKKFGFDEYEISRLKMAAKQVHEYYQKESKGSTGSKNISENKQSISGNDLKKSQSNYLDPLQTFSPYVDIQANQAKLISEPKLEGMEQKEMEQKEMEQKETEQKKDDLSDEVVNMKEYDENKIKELEEKHEKDIKEINNLKIAQKNTKESLEKIIQDLNRNKNKTYENMNFTKEYLLNEFKNLILKRNLEDKKYSDLSYHIEKTSELIDEMKEEKKNILKEKKLLNDKFTIVKKKELELKLDKASLEDTISNLKKQLSIHSDRKLNKYLDSLPKKTNYKTPPPIQFVSNKKKKKKKKTKKKRVKKERT